MSKKSILKRIQDLEESVTMHKQNVDLLLAASKEQKRLNKVVSRYMTMTSEKLLGSSKVTNEVFESLCRSMINIGKLVHTMEQDLTATIEAIEVNRSTLSELMNAIAKSTVLESGKSAMVEFPSMYKRDKEEEPN